MLSVAILSSAATLGICLLLRVPGRVVEVVSTEGEKVVTNHLVGATEAEIREEYGRPTIDKEGYHSLALKVPSSLPSGPIRTLIFPPRGGTLWV
jgi:hypothetical protein